MYIPKRRHPQSSKLHISLIANAFNRLKDCIFTKNHLQSSKTIDLLRGYAYTLTPHLYTLTLNLDPDPDFKLITTLIPTLIPTIMKLTEKERAAMANKYGYGINADKATKDELVEFIKTIIYLTQDLTDNDLWYIF